MALFKVIEYLSKKKDKELNSPDTTKLYSFATPLENKNSVPTINISSAMSDSKSIDKKVMQSVWMATIGELAAGVVHEINNPLSIIQGNLSFIFYLNLWSWKWSRR